MLNLKSYFVTVSAFWVGSAALAQKLEAGTVWVNQHGILDARFPMGGVKESGLGSEYGLAGLLGYTNPRVVNVKLGHSEFTGASK